MLIALGWFADYGGERMLARQVIQSYGNSVKEMLSVKRYWLKRTTYTPLEARKTPDDGLVKRMFKGKDGVWYQIQFEPYD